MNGTTSSIVAIGTDIYLIGVGIHNSYHHKNVYRYDTLTDTYTQLTDIPYDFTRYHAVAVNTDIYLFNVDVSASMGAYKYNTLTDEYTQITDVPHLYTDSKETVAIGTDIYFQPIYNDFYKYNTLTDEYILLDRPPKDFNNTPMATLDTDIYFFGEGGDNKSIYKYDTLTGEYTRLAEAIKQITYSNTSVIQVYGNFYLFDNDSMYRYINKIPTNKTIYIETKSSFYTKLSKKLSIYFSNARIYDNEKLLLYPVYYGDGQRWSPLEIVRSLKSIMTESGDQIITEYNELIELEG